MRESATLMGNHAAPDDCYLALRGLRTAGVRLRQHEQAGLHLAHWLEKRKEVARVLHPALPTDPGHELWKRDFTGACGLFGVVLAAGTAKKGVDAMLDGMKQQAGKSGIADVQLQLDQQYKHLVHTNATALLQQDVTQALPQIWLSSTPAATSRRRASARSARVGYRMAT